MRLVLYLVPLLLLLWVFVRRWQRRAKISRIGARTPVPVQALAAQFTGQGLESAVVEDLLREVAIAVEFPAELLRPSDRFDRELRPRWWEFGDRATELAWSAEHRQSQSGIAVDTGAVQTVADYVLTFAPLEQVIRSRKRLPGS